MFSRLGKRRPQIKSLAVLPIATLFWIPFATAGTRVRHTDFLPFALASCAGLVIVTAWKVLGGEPIRTLLLLLVGTTTTFVGLFSYFYWSYGDQANFSQPLTHLDAVYVTMGTLSTAGTGDIVATSEIARAIQTGEMILGMVLILGAVAGALARMSNVSR